MSRPSPLHDLASLLDRARRRLRARAALRGGVVGAAVGLALGTVACGLLAAGSLLSAPLAVAAGLAVATLGTALGAVVAAARSPLDRREAALLLDRRLGTDELFVTALHLSADAPRRAVVVDALARTLAGGVDLGRAVPLGVPRPARWLPVGVLAVVVAALIPPVAGPTVVDPTDPLGAEGERLASRIEALAREEAEGLPSPLSDEVADLAAEMRGGRLTEEEARRRLEELQEQLEGFEESLEPSADLLEDLEEAAEALDTSAATGPLADALSRGDAAAAAQAARDLAEQLVGASPEERQRAAEGLSEAGDRLARSSDPSLQSVGEALQQAGEAASGQQGQQGQQGQTAEGASGQQGAQQGGQQAGEEAGQQGGAEGAGSRPLTPEQAEALARQLEAAQELGERLERDREALERARELDRALEASRQRLGGDPSVDGGESSADGEGEGQSAGQGQGQGDGQGAGQGAGAGMGSGAGAGQGHTWEDAGEHVSAEGGTHEDRQSERSEGQVIDDFERLYASVRLEDAEALLASEKGQLDTTGAVDELVTRRTGSDEQATLPRLDLPARYEEAAAEAIRSEAVPPGYREAVKQYFDGTD